MANIDIEQFRARLFGGSLHHLVEDVLADDDPKLFRHVPNSYSRLKELVQRSLSIPHLVTDVECLVIGSAKFGYSISPDRFGSQFTAKSDVDVAVISGELFDLIWSRMLEWRYPWHVRKWHERDKRWGYSYLENHFVGWIEPHKIRVEVAGLKQVPKPIQSIANTWFDTFKRAASLEPIRGHDASGRLFRSMSHLAMYQRWGLHKITSQLRE